MTATHADGVQVKGVTSGATGFVFGEGTSATNVNLTNVVGSFVAGEKIIASDSAESDDIVENSSNVDLTISSVVTKSFADFRQVFMDDPTNADEDFTADVDLSADFGSRTTLTGNISIANSGTTITGSGTKFNTELVIGDQITFIDNAGSTITKIVENKATV